MPTMQIGLIETGSSLQIDNKIPPELQGNIPAHSRFAKDITVGLRWNVTPSIMLRAEYHYINGTGWISPFDNLAPG